MKNSDNGGMSFMGFLGILFITLKLVGVIDWSWWWVTAPIWGGLAVALVLGVALPALVVLISLIYAIINRRG